MRRLHSDGYALSDSACSPCSRHEPEWSPRLARVPELIRRHGMTSLMDCGNHEIEFGSFPCHGAPHHTDHSSGMSPFRGHVVCPPLHQPPPLLQRSLAPISALGATNSVSQCSLGDVAPMV